MQDESKPDPDPAAEADRIESTILDLFTGPGGSGLWSVEEVGREIGDEIKAADALEALHRSGLIHRTSDGFVFATRAAIRASELQI
jgi:hypothetical protein